MLRRVVLAVAAASVVAGALLVLLTHGVARAVGIYLLVEALVCFLAVAFERSRYTPRATDRSGLRPTGERSVDPVSGRLVEVWEEPSTGQREYRQGREDR